MATITIPISYCIITNSASITTTVNHTPYKFGGGSSVGSALTSASGSVIHQGAASAQSQTLTEARFTKLISGEGTVSGMATVAPISPVLQKQSGGSVLATAITTAFGLLVIGGAGSSNGLAITEGKAVMKLSGSGSIEGKAFAVASATVRGAFHPVPPNVPPTDWDIVDETPVDTVWTILPNLERKW